MEGSEVGKLEVLVTVTHRRTKLGGRSRSHGRVHV